MTRGLAVAVATWMISGPVVAAERVIGERTFTFPDDYSLELVAGSPLVDRPMEADMDEDGRLYVTESSGSNDPVEVQLKERPHRVLRLVDVDGDGRYDERTVFADGLMLPQGCLWHEGSLYVAAPPHIWKLTDADGDGVAESRHLWFDGKSLTGCANDLHGPYLGPDGWIYWCKGAFAAQTYDLPGRPGWKSSAAHVFRARVGEHGPVGIEPVFTAGMDNPVGLAWTPEGDLIVAGTFFQHPGGGQRDGLIHAVRGGVWGKDHGVLDDHPRTGALMPPMTHLGPAAPAGLARYGRDLLCAQFNMRRVSRHALTPEGATYRTTDSDFLVCDHPDFHPTDVMQAPDGSVLVIDTGGWYKLCCPTSQVAKPHALGAIYRLRRTGGEVPVAAPPPRWTQGVTTSPPAQLALLQNGNPHQRRGAAEALAALRMESTVPVVLRALESADLDRFLFHAFTNTLREIGAAEPTRLGLIHDHPAVRAAALYALEQMPAGALRLEDVLPHLSADDARLRDASLFVVGRHPEWVEEVAGWIRDQPPSTIGEDALWQRVVVALGGQQQVRDLLAAELSAAPTREARRQWLAAMAALRLQPLPASWPAALATALAETDTETQQAVLAIVAAASPADRAGLAPSLERLAADETTDPSVRLTALAALDRQPLGDREFSFLLEQLAVPEVAATAAHAIRTRSLTKAQRSAVADAIPVAGLLARPALIQSFAGDTDEAVGLRLVAAMDQSGALAVTPPDLLRETMARFPAAVHDALAAAQEKWRPADQAARLDAMESTLPSGDIERGLIVFQSPQAACATCHPLGYKGGTLGPDLSKVGAIRTRRDLLEALVYPSASFVRSYEPVQLTRNDGSVVYGMVTDQSPESLTLATGAATPPVTVARRDIASMDSGRHSLMPQGIEQILSAQELADIIAYLMSRR